MENTNKENSIKVFQFNSSYPDPKFSSVKNKDYVKYGDDNRLDKYISDLVTKSSVHASILSDIKLFTIGNGFSEPIDEELLPIYNNEMTDANFNSLFKDDINSVLNKIVGDMVLYGAWAINVRWSKDRTMIADYSYVDVTTLRRHSNGVDFWVSDDWSKNNSEMELLKGFDSSDKGKREDSSQIIYVLAPGSINRSGYALPRYFPAREMIEADQEIDNYNLNRLRNSFMANAILRFQNAPEAEQLNQIQKQLQNYFGGAKNANKTIVLTGENVSLDKFESNSTPKDYEWIQNNIYQKIMTAHGIVGDGALAGLHVGGGGISFSTDQILNEYEVFMKKVIRPNVKQIEDVFNAIAKINGYEGEEKLEIVPLSLFESANQAESNLDSNNNIVEAEVSGIPVNIDANPVSSPAAAALNGAQISSLIEIINQISAGVISRETAKPLIIAAFPDVSIELIDQILNGIRPVAPEQINEIK